MSAEDLADRVRAGVEALRAGRSADAIDQLLPVALDADFAEAEDLDDVRARVWSLLAQALHAAGRSREAEPWARRAIAAAEAQGDAAGAEAVRVLHRAIFAAATEAGKAERAALDARRLAATPLHDVLAGVSGDAEAAAALVAKANADVDAGRPDEGAAVARMALQRARDAGDVREEVLALLVLARATPSEAARHLQDAWTVADAADEFNLVTAVARAADVAGVTLGILHGPGGR